MAALLITILTVEVAKAVANCIGTVTINNLLWKLYTSTVIETSHQMREQRELQNSYLQVRRDLNATSSQDEFAKWAKLRRQHDKMLDDLEKLKSTIDETKASFDKAVSSVRCISTSGARWFLPFWYAREPTFWLPYGWFPYYAEWLISFPAAPLGSVSVASWQLASTAIISIVVNSMGAIFRLVVHARQRTNSRQEAAVEKRRSSLCIEDEGVQESRKNL